MSKGIAMRPKEMETFTTFASDARNEAIEYEDYVAQLVEANEKHL